MDAKSQSLSVSDLRPQRSQRETVDSDTCSARGAPRGASGDQVESERDLSSLEHLSFVWRRGFVESAEEIQKFKEEDKE